MKLRPIGFALALATLAAPGGWAVSEPPAVALSQPIHSAGAATVEVNLQGADAATIAQKLGSSLGATVRIEGAVPGPVTLDLSGATARAALDATARALYGTWRPIYRVTAGAAPAGAPRPVPLGRTVTVSLTDASARAAFALVARAGEGTLEMPPGLEKNVSLAAKDLPVEEALDELAKQAGASWSVTYVISTGVAPPSPTRPQPAAAPNSPSPRAPQSGFGRPGARQPGASLNGLRSFPMPGEALGTGDNAGKMLAMGLAQVMRMPPAQQKGAVKDFALQLDQQFRLMQMFPAARRQEQMAAMRPVYQAALQTYNGLAPAQRPVFQPIMAVFSRWMR